MSHQVVKGSNSNLFQKKCLFIRSNSNSESYMRQFELQDERKKQYFNSLLNKPIPSKPNLILKLHYYNGLSLKEVLGVLRRVIRCRNCMDTLPSQIG